MLAFISLPLLVCATYLCSVVSLILKISFREKQHTIMMLIIPKIHFSTRNSISEFMGSSNLAQGQTNSFWVDPT